MKTFSLVNSLLARKEPYTKQSWSQHQFYFNKIVSVEKTLSTLKELGYLPSLDKEKLLFWLLHEAPLIEKEKNDIRIFAFEIDYY